MKGCFDACYSFRNRTACWIVEHSSSPSAFTSFSLIPRLKNIFNSKPHLLRHGVFWDNEYFSCAGEHPAEDPFPHCQWRGRGHVQRPPLYPTSEVCYDARGAERVRSVWGHLGAPPLYTSEYRYLSFGMLGKRCEGKRIEVMSGCSHRLSVTSTEIR